MRITVDLAKASTDVLDLTSVLNPRVGDGDLKLPFHITYGESNYDMRGKSMNFLSEGSDQKKIYVSGTVDESTSGDDPYSGNVTFTFPTGTFKTAGTYDPDKTMFQIVNREDNSVISTVNVKMTVLPNDSDVANPDDESYNSRLEKVVSDFAQKGKAALSDAQAQAKQVTDDAKQQADAYLNDVKQQGNALLDEIKQTDAEAKGNVAGDTAATAKQAKQQANDNASSIHDLHAEVGDARGRFMNLSDRENKQDFNIDRKEDKSNANANYAAQDLRNDNQDKEIAKKANQSFITDYLSKMYLEPEGLENEVTLKAKYPDGKPGIFVTVDTGHKWIWENGQWNDCGIYQSAGIAYRSIASSQIKQSVLKLRVSQQQPWIVDYGNRKLTVSGFSYIYDDIPHQIEAGDYVLPSDFNPVYIGYDAAEGKLNFYKKYEGIPESSYFVGIIDIFGKLTWMSFKNVNSDNIPDKKMSLINDVKRQNLPALGEGLVSLGPWKIDTYAEEPSINVDSYSVYVIKNNIFEIKQQKYMLDRLNGDAYYLYLDLDYTKFTADIKATDNPTLINDKNPWIGYIETNTHVYNIFNNSNDLLLSSNRLITPGKFSVDFDKGTVHIPIIWFAGNLLTNSISTDKEYEIDFDLSKPSLFVGIDPTKSKINEMIVIDSSLQKITDSYQYIGWIDVTGRRYNFGESGSSHDLANQPWTNRKITCLGDSITEGDSGEGGLIDSYVPRMAKYLDTTPTNKGKCGAKITKADGNTDSFVERSGDITNQDVVTIFGGINDFQWNAPLGAMTDTADNPTTFYGALKYLVINLSKQNPKAKLMFITPMKTTKFQYHTFDSDGNMMKNGNGNTQLDFVNAIKQVASYYSIPVLDMYNCSNYSPYIPSQVGHDNFTADGLHPTAHGYERIAQTIAHAINNL